MNKKEIAEIKKQFTPERSPLTHLCGCYVDGDKNKKTVLSTPFFSLSEEEQFKYFDILKKTLSGTLEKNLLNMEFPLDQEKEDGTQHFLYRLRQSKLQNQALVDEFFDKVIEAYEYMENYYIILVYGVYDIPGKATDGTELFDASTDVYDFMICSLCPVNLSKAGLCYNADTNNIEECIRDWLVQMPANGFLFPAFNDRNTDIHSVLYYTKNADEIGTAFVDTLLGCTAPLGAVSQKDSFHALIEETLGEACSYDTVVDIHNTLNSWVEAQKDSPDPVILTKPEVKRLFSESGVDDQHLEAFDEQFDTLAGDTDSFAAANIAIPKKYEIKTPGVTVHVSPERAGLVQTRVIDGRHCLMIPLDMDVEVNGIRVSITENTDSDDDFEFDF